MTWPASTEDTEESFCFIVCCQKGLGKASIGSYSCDHTEVARTYFESFNTYGEDSLHVKRYCDVRLGSKVTAEASSEPIPRNVTKLTCSKCNHCIMEGEWKVKEMPSKYWMELIDCWSCHQSEFAMVTTKLLFSKEDGGLLLPKSPNDLLYQGTFIVLQRVDSPEIVTCQSCESMLGRRLSAVEGICDSILLYLDRVSLFNGNDSNSFDLISVLARQLVEHIESHSTRSFKIGSTHVKVISWTLHVAVKSNDGRGHGNEPPKLRPAIFLQKYQSDSIEDDSEWVSLGWPPHHCEAFMAAVDRGSSLAGLLEYPPSSSIIPFTK